MDPLYLIAGALLALLVLANAVAIRRALWLRRFPQLEGVSIDTPVDDTTVDDEGACRSVQSATVTMPAERADELFTPLMLERLGRTYWAFLPTFTLGFVRVFYSAGERAMSLLVKPLKLLVFAPPEYEFDDGQAKIRWRIVGGMLVARRGREERRGHLEIEVVRLEPAEDGSARIHVEVEVESFYPLLERVSPWLYHNTQSRFHVLLAYGFMHRLVRRDLDRSVIGRFAS